MSLDDFVKTHVVGRGDVDKTYYARMRCRAADPGYFVMKTFHDYTGHAAVRYRREVWLNKLLHTQGIGPEVVATDDDSLTMVLRHFPHKAPMHLSDLWNFIPPAMQSAASMHQIEIDLLPPDFDVSGTVTEKGRRDAVIRVRDDLERFDELTELYPWLYDALTDLADHVGSSEFRTPDLHLIHGDLHPFNVLVNPNTSESVLIDHGRARIADPAYDVGSFIYRTANGQFFDIDPFHYNFLFHHTVKCYTEAAGLSSEEFAKRTWAYNLFSLATDLPWNLYMWREIDPSRKEVANAVVHLNIRRLFQAWENNFEPPANEKINLWSPGVKTQKTHLDYSIALICHPPYIQYLENHLLSVQSALKGRNTPIALMLSQANDDDIESAMRIVEQFNDLNIIFNTSGKPLTIGQQRNMLWDLTDSRWTIFFDTDTVVHHKYFENLDNTLQVFGNDPIIKAIAGGIGIERATKWGMWEAYMDLSALVGKIFRLNTSIFDSFLTDFEFPTEPDLSAHQNFSMALMWELGRYSGVPIGYLQGFNQIIHRDIREELSGFDDRFMSAEDREMAAKIRSAGYQILFDPSVMVFHNYEFGLRAVLGRKKTHGIWSERFRQKYRDRPDIVSQYDTSRWLQVARSVLSPPKPFSETWEGRVYYALSILSYSTACIQESIRFQRNGSGIPVIK